MYYPQIQTQHFDSVLPSTSMFGFVSSVFDATSPHSPPLTFKRTGRDGGLGPGRGRGRARLPGKPWDGWNDVMTSGGKTHLKFSWKMKQISYGRNSRTKVCLKSFFVVAWFDHKQGHIFNFPSFRVSYMCVLPANQRNTRWWFQIYSCLFGEDFQFDEHTFQMGGSTTNQNT